MWDITPLCPLGLNKRVTYISTTAPALTFSPEMAGAGHLPMWRLTVLGLSLERQTKTFISSPGFAQGTRTQKLPRCVEEPRACCRDAQLHFSASVSRDTDSDFLFAALLLYMIMLKIQRGLCIILFPILIYSIMSLKMNLNV